MNNLKEKDKVIMQKEHELNRLMIEYYSFDMQNLKEEIDHILENEANKIS
jgi:hypothetical protein